MCRENLCSSEYTKCMKLCFDVTLVAQLLWVVGNNIIAEQSTLSTMKYNCSTVFLFCLLPAIEAVLKTSVSGSNIEVWAQRLGGPQRDSVTFRLFHWFFGNIQRGSYVHIDIDHVFISLIHIPHAAVHHYTKVLLSGLASFRHKC